MGVFYRLRHWPGTDFCGPLSKTSGVPRNKFDAACKAHDEDYARIHAKTGKYDHYWKFNDADEKFVKRLRKISGIGPDLSIIFFRWKQAMQYPPAERGGMFAWYMAKELPAKAKRTWEQFKVALSPSKKPKLDGETPPGVKRPGDVLPPSADVTVKKQKVEQKDILSVMTSVSNNFCCVQLKPVVIGNKKNNMSKATESLLGEWYTYIDESTYTHTGAVTQAHWAFWMPSSYNCSQDKPYPVDNSEPAGNHPGGFNQVPMYLRRFDTNSLVYPLYNGPKVTDIKDTPFTTCFKNQKLEMHIKNESTEGLTANSSQCMVEIYVLKCKEEVQNIDWNTGATINQNLANGWVRKYEVTSSVNPPKDSNSQADILTYSDNMFLMKHFKILAKRQVCLNYKQSCMLNVSMPGTHYVNGKFMEHSLPAPDTDPGGVGQWFTTMVREGEIAIIVKATALGLDSSTKKYGVPSLTCYGVKKYEAADMSLQYKTKLIRNEQDDAV